MLSGVCLHHHSHQMVLHMEVGSSQVEPSGIKDEGKLRILLSQRNAIAGTVPHAQTLTLFSSPDPACGSFPSPGPPKKEEKKKKKKRKGKPGHFSN